MELMLAAMIGVLTATGTYLLLRLRTFPVVLGLAMLSYAVNVFIFAAGGRLVQSLPPILGHADSMADPLPQALVLTAIVISFGMTALVVILALGSYLNSGTDVIDIDKPGEQHERSQRGG